MLRFFDDDVVATAAVPLGRVERSMESFDGRLFLCKGYERDELNTTRCHLEEKRT